MENLGIVREIVNQNAKIEMFASSACGKCDHCSGEHKSSEFIEIANTQNLSIGDNVVVEISDKEVFKIGAITYLFPVAGFFIGYAVGAYFSKLELTKILSSFGGVIVSFIIIAIYDKFSASKKNPFKIKKI